MKTKLLYIFISIKIFWRCVVRGIYLAKHNYGLLSKKLRLGDTVNYNIEIKLETKHPDDSKYAVYPVTKLSDIKEVYERLGGEKLPL